MEKKKNPDNFVRRVGRVHGPQPFIGRFITLRNIILGEFDNIRRRRDFSSIVFLLALFPRRLRYSWRSSFELNTTTPPRARTVNGFAKTNKICYIIQQPPPPQTIQMALHKKNLKKMNTFPNVPLSRLLWKRPSRILKRYTTPRRRGTTRRSAAAARRISSGFIIPPVTHINRIVV